MTEYSSSAHSQSYLRYSFPAGKATALTADVLLGEGRTMGRELTRAVSPPGGFVHWLTKTVQQPHDAGATLTIPILYEKRG